MKKGFTLIELLAVIVILAIIALIATPIILGIINDAKEESNERSIELYNVAVRNGVAAYQLRTGNKVQAGIYNKEKPLPFEVEVEGDVECETIEIKENGEVIVSNCTVNGKKIEGTKEEELPLVKVNLESVCTPSTTQKYTSNPLTPGYRYECKVDPNKDRYTFYVLSSDDTSVNLIMDSNVREGGTPIKEPNPTDEQKGLIAWINKTHFLENGGIETDWNNNTNMNVYGPITAMDYLQSVTSTWTNTNTQIINSYDECDSNMNCTNYTMAKKYRTNTRMPNLTELVAAGCKMTNNALAPGLCPVWLIDHLDGYADEQNGIEGRTSVELIGYWTSTAKTGNTKDFASIMAAIGNVEWSVRVSFDSMVGVRPVINLSK